ncbi:MAG: response regulator [Deltaproteobacteria bacterium]|nr:response regulator [Deltaproteobacteria bacterium]
MLNSPKITILNVDDNEIIRYLVTEILHREGFEVMEAATGNEALRLAAMIPDLIILDVHLPDMSGFEVCRRIRANPATAAIPILHLSATAVDDESRVTGLDSGADGYLTHPVPNSVLTAFVRSLIRMRQKDKELLAAARQWQVTFDAVSDLIWLMDAEQRILQCNKSTIRFLGKPSTEIIGRPCYEVIHNLSEPIAGCPSRCVKDTRCREEQVLSENNKWFNIAVDPIRDQNGNLVGFVHIMSDITDRKRMEEDRKRTEQQLRQAQKMEAIGTLAGGIAHDFNNILGAMLGYTQLAALDAPPGSQLSGFLGEVLKSGRRAKDLVKQILTFSRQSEQVKQPILIGPIIKEAAKLLRASLPATIEIRQNIADQVGPILGDPTQIHQVLMNLCTNASQAMGDKGGVLSISLEEVMVTLEQSSSDFGLDDGRYVRLRISDTGPGIDRKIQDRIFEPYFTTKGIGEGTGLGLATVHGIVETHRGVIKLYSEPGQGTTFSIYLPRHSIDTGQVVTIQESLESGSEKILLIDDEVSLVEMGSRMLQRLGYQVTRRTSSLEALELFRSQPDRFDLVITDQTMPQMTGLDLAKELLKIRPEIPIILCTGFSSSVTPETIQAIGIRGLIMKPMLMEEISKTIRTIMENKDR